MMRRIIGELCFMRTANLLQLSQQFYHNTNKNDIILFFDKAWIIFMDQLGFFKFVAKVHVSIDLKSAA